MSPYSAKDILRSSEEDTVVKQRMVEKIDSYLKTNFMGRPVEYNITELMKLEGFREALLGEIIEEYKQLGWANVKLGGAGTEGRYIHFEYISPEKMKINEEKRALKEEKIARKREYYLKRDIKDSELGFFIKFDLEEANVKSIKELVSLSEEELWSRGISEDVINKIRKKLKEYGLKLAGD
jgi:hypothetical protein